MKQYKVLLILLFVSVFITSCSVVTGIFKAGMGFGIFLVIAVIAGIVILITRSRKK